LPLLGECVKDAQITCIEWSVLPAYLCKWNLNDRASTQGNHVPPAASFKRVYRSHAVAGTKDAICSGWWAAALEVSESCAAHLKTGALFEDCSDRVAHRDLVQTWVAKLIARHVATQVEQRLWELYALGDDDH
jgi:hypothetical protein